MDAPVVAVAKRAVGLGHGLPDEVLAEVLNFSGLREFAACAAAGSKLRGGLERLSPALGYQLVMSRFPILALMFEGAETTELPPPRELFESQARMFRPPPHHLPTRGLDDYTFFVEIEIFHGDNREMTYVEVYAGSLWAGKGSPSSSGFATDPRDPSSPPLPGIEFSIPSDVFERCCDVWRNRSQGPDIRSIRVNIMATRRSSEGMQRALLGHDWLYGPNVGSNVGVHFWLHDMSYHLYDSGWLEQCGEQANCFHLPTIRAEWLQASFESDLTDAGQSRFFFSFMWSETENESDMTVEDACLALEHYYTWVTV
jgi:hypothetical protein